MQQVHTMPVKNPAIPNMHLNFYNISWRENKSRIKQRRRTYINFSATPSLGQRTRSGEGFSTSFSACTLPATNATIFFLAPKEYHEFQGHSRFTLQGTKGWEAILDQLQRQPSAKESASCSYSTQFMLRGGKKHLVFHALPCHLYHALPCYIMVHWYVMLSSCCHSVNLACCTLSWKSLSEPGRFGASPHGCY